LAKGNWLLTPNNYILKNKKINNDETKWIVSIYYLVFISFYGTIFDSLVFFFFVNFLWLYAKLEISLLARSSRQVIHATRNCWCLFLFIVRRSRLLLCFFSLGAGESNLIKNKKLEQINLILQIFINLQSTMGWSLLLFPSLKKKMSEKMSDQEQLNLKIIHMQKHTCGHSSCGLC
jgi:hypothetical protein